MSTLDKIIGMISQPKVSQSTPTPDAPLRTITAMVQAQRTSGTVTLFNNLSWISFYNEVYIKRCELAYKRIKGTLPDHLNASLRKNSDVHSRGTRYCNINLLFPHYRNIREGGRTFNVRTVKGSEQ